MVVRRCMETVLETVPEFKGKAELALKTFPNFTHEQMAEMFRGVYDNPVHQILLAEDESSGEILGHAIYSIKTDEQGVDFGFCFSRYVTPSVRRKGVASALLQAQESWWRTNGAKYAVARTHERNTKLQKLFEKRGYDKTGPYEGDHFSYYGLKKPLREEP